MELVYRLEDISRAAEIVMSNVKGSNILAFEGEMGSGKTTFIHAIFRQLELRAVSEARPFL